MKQLFLLLMVSFCFGEPSVFDAGNLDSNQPYGLSKDEKYIWKNIQSIKKLNKIVKIQSLQYKKQQKELNSCKLKLLDLKMKTDNLNQKIDGMETIFPYFDKLSIDLKTLKHEFNRTKTIVLSSVTDIVNLKNQVTQLKTDINNLQQIVNNNKDNTKMVIGLIDQLVLHIDKIDSKLTTLNKKLKQNSDFRNLPKSVIFNKALNYFKVSQYTKAKEMFNYLYNQKYKPATSLFYLGEIEYKRGHYKQALSFYKNSVKEYPKSTSFTAELLYHTGYSFEKLNNPKAAKISYQKILNDYPDSIFVKYAKKRLDNLEKTK